jgi:hypothetical protein
VTGLLFLTAGKLDVTIAPTAAISLRLLPLSTLSGNTFSYSWSVCGRAKSTLDEGGSARPTSFCIEAGAVANTNGFVLVSVACFVSDPRLNT